MFDGEIQGYQSEGGASEFSKLTDDEYFGGYFPEEDGMTGGAVPTGVLDGDNSLTNLINTFNPFIIMGIHDNEDELQIKYKEKILKIVNDKLKQIDSDRDSDSGIGKKVPYFFALINDIIVSSLIFLQTTFGNEYNKLINFQTRPDDISVNLKSILTFLSKYKKYLISPPENSPVLSTIGVLINQVYNSNEIELQKNDIEELVEKIKENSFKEEEKEQQQQPSNLTKLMIAKINGLLNHVEGTDNPVHQQPANGDDNGDPDPVQSNRDPKSDDKTPSQSPSASTGNASSGSQQHVGNLLLDFDTNNEGQTQSSSMPGNPSSSPQQQRQQQAQSTASTPRANEEEEHVNDDSDDSDSISIHSSDDDDDADEDADEDEGSDKKKHVKGLEKHKKRAEGLQKRRKAAQKKAEQEAQKAQAAKPVSRSSEKALNELAEAENTSTTTAPQGVEPFSELAPSDLNK